MTRVLPIGAAYGVPLADGRFGLIRVIGHGGRKPRQYGKLAGESAICVRALATRWVGTRKQLATALADPRARQPLVPSFSRKAKKPYVVWATQVPPPTFIHVGILMPTAREQMLEGSDIVWEWVPLQYKAQLEYEADPAAFEAKMRALREPAPASPAMSRERRRGTAPELSALAKRKPFADWEPTLRKRARDRIAALVAKLRDEPREAKRDLRAIASCARAFNRERDMGTLEAEALDQALLDIACAVGIDIDDYAAAIDAVRDW